MRLARAGWQGLAFRFLSARRSRSLLTALGVAVGAALLTAVVTLGATLQAAVVDQMREQFGTYDVMVGAPDVTTDVLTPPQVDTVTAMDEVAYAVPLLLRTSGQANSPIAVYTGVGPFPPEELGTRLAQGRMPGDGEVVLPVAVAERLGVTLGEPVTLPFPDGDRQVQVVGLVAGAGQPAAALYSYEWLREQLHESGPSLLMVGLRPGASKRGFAARLQAEHPSLNLDLRTYVDEWRNTLGGFGLVGRLLGAGALATSAFLVLGAFGITLQERRRELALLRAVGAAQTQIVRLVLVEAMAIGLTGATGGIILGLTAAMALQGLVSRQLQIPGHPVVLPLLGLAISWCATFLLTVAAAWAPARQAGATAPLAAMRPDRPEPHRSRDTWRPAICLALAAAAVAASYGPGLEVPARFMLSVLGALLLFLAVLTGLGRLLPLVTRILAALAKRRFAVQVTLSQRNLGRQGPRAARTAGVLVLGLALLITVGALISTETASHERTLRAVFPTGAKISGPWGSPMGYGDDLVHRLRQIPGVAAAISLGLEVEADLVGYDTSRADPEWLERMRRTREAPERVWLQSIDFEQLSAVYPYGEVEGTLQGGLVLTRRLAADMGFQLGDTIQFNQTALPITALVENLPSSMVMAVDQQTLNVEPQYRTTLIQLEPDADRTAVKEAAHALLGARYAAFTYEDLTDVLAHGRRRQQQNMAMVATAVVVLLMTTAVGMVTMVTAVLQERQHEFATLRAIGTTPGEIAGLIITEMALLGGAASILGTFLGVTMTMITWLHAIAAGEPVALPWGLIAAGLTAGPLLGALASWWPLQRATAHP
jgi:putative ABC transport system permease protein